jgi:hypothetical protein
MKKIALTAAVMIATLAPASAAFAYVGGPGIPPGFGGGTVECHMKTIHLPFVGDIQIPICRPGQHNGWKDRWEEFIDRVVHGNGHQHGNGTGDDNGNDS